MVKILLLKEWVKSQKKFMYLRKEELMIFLLDFKNKNKNKMMMIMKEDQKNI